jgi:hypothetical protein
VRKDASALESQNVILARDAVLSAWEAWHAITLWS